jgi:DHA1 family tetracycline resistance protein-like MFS transporter
VGLSLTFVGVVIAFYQAVVVGKLIPKLGEEKSVTLGLLVNALCFAAFGLANRGWMMYAIVAVFGLGGVAMTATQSIIARHVPASEQGEMQGSLVSLGSLASVVAPAVFTYLFVGFTRRESLPYVPGAAYLGAAAISAMALAIWVCSLPEIRRAKASLDSSRFDRVT